MLISHYARICCFNLGQVGLVGAAQGSGLHMLWYQALVSEDMQGQPLSGWAQVWMDHSVCLCKGHGRAQKSSMKGYHTAEYACYYQRNISSQNWNKIPYYHNNVTNK